jgi:hypothetical protein
VDEVEKREEQLQLSYVELLDERDRLHTLLYGSAEGGEGDNGGAATAALER